MRFSLRELLLMALIAVLVPAFIVRDRQYRKEKEVRRHSRGEALRLSECLLRIRQIVVDSSPDEIVGPQGEIFMLTWGDPQLDTQPRAKGQP